jgi:small subunit ribosomal protein S1
MEVVVLELDKDNRRLSLGHKQLEENPWDVYETLFIEGSEHEGTVVKVKDKSGIVSMPYGVEGFCPVKHMKKEDGESLKTDDKMQFKVIEFNKDAKKLIVSHTAIWGEVAESSKRESAAKTSRAVKSMNDGQEKTTLGDLGGLAELKKKMEGK